MADSYEVVLAVDLDAGVDGDELAELRWHVGEGPVPARFPLGTDRYLPAHPLGDPGDPDCAWETAAPEPLFAGRGPARHIGGTLSAGVRGAPGGWSLAVRQELHPDEFYALRALLAWLGRHGTGGHIGHLRCHEGTEVTPLVLTGGAVALPEDITAHTPHWEP
jgi:hypothetical protein